MYEVQNASAMPSKDALQVFATDVFSSTGAAHRYEIRNFNTNSNNHRQFSDPFEQTVLLFQNGEQPYGPNGITMEALLAICWDRLNRFQMGPYPSHHNQQAMFSIQQALYSLHQRTLAEAAPPPMTT